jgi:hypothetical protein
MISCASFFFANRTLALKETLNCTKHLKKNEKYNKILEKPFIFNLQTVSMARCRCRSFLSRPDVIDCGQEVTEQVKKTTSVPKTKKKEELSMNLFDDPKIPTVRQNPRRPHHSHKPLDVTAEMGLKPGRPYCTRHRHHHLSATPANLNPKNEERSPQNGGWSPSTDEGRDPPRLHGPKATKTGRSATTPAGGRNSDGIASPGRISCVSCASLIKRKLLINFTSCCP